MERYYSCSEYQKEILTKLYEYLGFSEVTSFEDYISFMFKNAKVNITFEHIVNHTLAHIVTGFWELYPQYKKSNYIKYMWLSESNMLDHMIIGSTIEYDSKGMLRNFVVNNYSKLVATKR